MIVHALPPTHAGVSSGLNSTTRELGSPGPGEQAVRQSITTALTYAGGAPTPAARAHLIAATRDAFTSGTSLGLRVGAALLLLATVVVAVQHPNDAPRLPRE
jgi:hypothetical protein